MLGVVAARAAGLLTGRAAALTAPTSANAAAAAAERLAVLHQTFLRGAMHTGIGANREPRRRCC
jgi:hypothetical protein